MQGTWVWAPVREDPTCHGATKPMRHNTTTEPVLYSPWATTTEAHAPRARAPQQEKPPQWEARAPQQSISCSLQLEKAYAQQRRPNTAK